MAYTSKEVNERWYRMKIIEFEGRTTPIILQNQKEPCPLIAICNILLLRNKMSLPTDRNQVRQWRLLTQVEDRLLSLLRTNENRKTIITDSIDSVPDLAKGLNVNVAFTRINDVKFAREYAVFGLLEIPVYHGWLIDPQDVETANAIGSKSYHTLMKDGADLESRKIMEGVSVKNPEEDHVENVEKEYTAHEASSSAVNVTEIESRPLTAKQVELVREFLHNNSTQLTEYGLNCLQEGVQDGELCVFFRNDHFSTMFKFEGALYLLVTDVGYEHQPGVVWEKLSEVNGDTVYVNKDFETYKPKIEVCTQDEESLIKKNALDGEPKERIYRTRGINFQGRFTRIIMQNEDGPCPPLIAICNTLLLRNKLDLSVDATVTEVLEEKLLKILRISLIGSVNDSEKMETILDAIKLLPRLASSVNLNVKFRRNIDIEIPEKGAVLFDLLNIPLYHAWLLDPRDAETSDAVGSKSYKDLRALLKATADPTSTSERKEGEVGITAREGELIKNFLENNESQLTAYGLFSLQYDLKPRELCVIYQNGHFHTMFKFQGELYTLVTDADYIDQPDVVWKKLREVTGDTVYVDKDFEVYKPRPTLREMEELVYKEKKEQERAAAMKEEAARAALISEEGNTKPSWTKKENCTVM